MSARWELACKCTETPSIAEIRESEWVEASPAFNDFMESYFDPTVAMEFEGRFSNYWNHAKLVNVSPHCPRHDRAYTFRVEHTSAFSPRPHCVVHENKYCLVRFVGDYVVQVATAKREVLCTNLAGVCVFRMREHRDLCREIIAGDLASMVAKELVHKGSLSRQVRVKLVWAPSIGRLRSSRPIEPTAVIVQMPDSSGHHIVKPPGLSGQQIWKPIDCSGALQPTEWLMPLRKKRRQK